MVVQGILSPCGKYCIIGGQIRRYARDHLREFCTPNCRVGQMKLETPLQYLGKRHLGIWVWLTQMECDICVMHYTPTEWLDVVTMRVEGATSSWVNVVLQDICCGHPFGNLTKYHLSANINFFWYLQYATYQCNIGIHSDCKTTFDDHSGQFLWQVITQNTHTQVNSIKIL